MSSLKERPNPFFFFSKLPLEIREHIYEDAMYAQAAMRAERLMYSEDPTEVKQVEYDAMCGGHNVLPPLYRSRSPP